MAGGPTAILSRGGGDFARSERHRDGPEASAAIGPVRGPGARPARGARGGRRGGLDHCARGTHHPACFHRPSSPIHASASWVCSPEPGNQPLLRGREARDALRGPIAVRRASTPRSAGPPCDHRGHTRDGQPRRPRRPRRGLHRDDPEPAGRAALHAGRQPRAAACHRRGQGDLGGAAGGTPRRRPRSARAPTLHATHDRRPRGTPSRARGDPRARLRDRRRRIRRRRTVRRRAGDRRSQRAHRRPLGLGSGKSAHAPALHRARPIAAAFRVGARRGRPREDRAVGVTVRAGLRGAPLISALTDLLGQDKVLGTREDLLIYEYDGAVDTATPDAVVLPNDTSDVAKLSRFCHQNDVPIVPRGAGTGLSGGAIPVEGGVVVSFARMSRILEIDVPNMRAVVQPGLVNLHLSTAAAPHGLYFVPDPSSQKACTIGGNVAENSGGPHTLAYGVTTNHVMGLEVVLPDGSVIRTGGKAPDAPGYDLTGLMVGSEGTLGIVTEVIVRLMRAPEAVKTLLGVFDSIDAASRAVADITAEAIIP